MTISLLYAHHPATPAGDEGHIRCDLCGRLVIDPAAHLIACVEHEIALFTIGRAS